jgi:alkylation response protein AidB-like acyl-CoA dehydrogenase
VVEKGTPGMEVARLEHKLGIKASDTAVIVFTDCRVHKSNLLGSEEVNVEKGFAGVMETFDNTRPLVAGMAVGVAKAALERTRELLKDSVPLDYSHAVECRQCRRRRAVPHGSRLGSCLPAHAESRLDGRQPHAEFERSLDGESESRAHLQ